MPECHDLIPPPPRVREELAACLRRTSLLRRLLRLSVRAAEERLRQIDASPDHQPQADSREVRH